MANNKTGLAVVIGAGIAAIAFAFGRKAGASPLDPFDVSVSDLNISPQAVYVGEPVAISVTVTNIGDVAGSYTITLGGDIMASQNVTLQPGESKQVTFSYTPNTAKVYSVNVDGLVGSFVATNPPTPAQFVVSNLVINPPDPFVGEQVDISVIVTNVGGTAGTKTVTMTVS